MGKFDGILICSDWDGTLHTENGVPQSNIEAINYFEEEGGLFTVCTGRHASHLARLISGFEINTYTISINGALILNQRDGEILHEGFFDDKSLPIVEKVLGMAKENYFSTVFYKLDGKPEIARIKKYEEYVKIFEQYPVYKFVYSGPLDSVLRVRDEVTDLGEYVLTRSWETGIELLHGFSTKGKGTLRVKEKTGCHLLVAVGNYENDIDMFGTADISYAVEGSCPDAIDAATYITAKVEDGAIAAVIKDIEERHLLP